MHGITLKNIKYSTKQGHDDSHTFTATVYRDGKRWCQASDDGWGGGINFTPLGDVSEEAFIEEYREVCRSLPAMFNPSDGGEIDVNFKLDIIVGNLINDYLLMGEFKKQAKKVIEFIESVSSDELFQYDMPYSKDMSRAVREKHKDAIVLGDLPDELVLAVYRGENAKDPDIQKQLQAYLSV